jgi:hypothetical protein
VFIVGSSQTPLAAALEALGQYRLQAMDNQAKTIQTKPLQQMPGLNKRARVSP